MNIISNMKIQVQRIQCENCHKIDICHVLHEKYYCPDCFVIQCTMDRCAKFGSTGKLSHRLFRHSMYCSTVKMRNQVSSHFTFFNRQLSNMATKAAFTPLTIKILVSRARADGHIEHVDTGNVTSPAANACLTTRNRKIDKVNNVMKVIAQYQKDTGMKPGHFEDIENSKWNKNLFRYCPTDKQAIFNEWLRQENADTHITTNTGGQIKHFSTDLSIPNPAKNELKSI